VVSRAFFVASAKVSRHQHESIVDATECLLETWLHPVSRENHG
jgi:hypothetical protein